MRFKLSKIQYRFIVQIIITLVCGLLVGGILVFTQKSLLAFNRLDREFTYMSHLVDMSYSSYSGFLADIDSDPAFFNEGQNTHTRSFGEQITLLRDTLDRIYSLGYLKRNIEQENLEDTLKEAISVYTNMFRNVTLAYKEKGNFDAGKVAELRKTSDKLLEAIYMLNDPELARIGQQLKKREVAYLYQEKSSAYYELDRLLSDLMYYTYPEETDFMLSNEVAASAEQYKKQLSNLENVLQRIGAGSRPEGMLEDFRESYNHLLATLEYVENSIAGATSTRRSWVWAVALFLIGLIGAAYIYTILQFSTRLRPAITFMQEHLFNLSKGKLQVRSKEIRLPWEFSQLAEYLTLIRNATQEKKRFVDDLLKQEFKADLNLQGKNDTFGKTLLALKENMRKTRDEQIRYAEENDHRRYLNEGVARFSDIMRASSNNMEKLGDDFIRQIVKYLEAIQGGLFLIDEKDEQKMNLVAAFAYNRKKYIDKSIGIGEGLVGTCAIEKKTINLTELPEDYIEITSGLGDAPPDNLLLLPVMHEGNLIGVIEIASLKKFRDVQIELGETIASSLAATIINARVNTRTSELLAKSQQQAAEMAEQEEEMRQNMEELKATQEESQRREEELEGMLSAIDQAFHVLEYDTEGIVIKANQKLLYLLDKHADQVIGKSHQELFGKGTKADSLLFANIAEGNAVEITEEVTINKKPTTLKHTFTPIRAKTGDTLRILNIMTINY